MSKIRIPGAVISFFLSTLFILCLTSPIMTYSGHGIRNGWAVFVLWFLTTIFWNKGSLDKTLCEIKRRKMEIFFLLGWIFVVLLNGVFNRGYTGDLHILLMLTMSMAFFMQLSYSGQRDGSFEVVMFMIVLLTGFEVIRSLPTLWLCPAIARNVMGLAATPEMIAEAGRASVGQYGYYTGLAIILPMIVNRTMMVKGRILKIVLWIIIGSIILAISISTFMGATLLMSIGLMIICILNLQFSKSKFKIMGYYALTGLCFYLVWANYVCNMPQGIYLKDKLENQINSVGASGLEQGDITGRWQTWAASFQGIKERPLIGVGPSTNRENPNLNTLVGGHSSWLDQLAEYGILGFGFYVLFFLSAVLRLFLNWSQQAVTREQKFAYAGQLASCILFFIGGTYNPVIVVTEINMLFTFLILCEPDLPVNDLPVEGTERLRLFEYLTHVKESSNINVRDSF